MILDDFDKMRSQLKVDKHGKALLKEFRKKLKQSENVSNKYGFFFDRVISDGENAEKAATDLNLL